MKLLEHNQKVEYLYNGEWLEGTIHGIQTHEDEDGIVSQVNYLIDTGNTVHEEPRFNEKGKQVGVIRFPEQLSLDQNFVKEL